MRMWPWGGRERTDVSPTTEIGIPIQAFVVSWLIGCLCVLVIYSLSWLWVLGQWLEAGSTFNAFLIESFKPHIRVEWVYVVMWCLVAFFPAAALLYFRLALETAAKSWLPWDLAALFKKDVSKK